MAGWVYQKDFGLANHGPAKSGWTYIVLLQQIQGKVGGRAGQIMLLRLIFSEACFTGKSCSKMCPTAGASTPTTR